MPEDHKDEPTVTVSLAEDIALQRVAKAAERFLKEVLDDTIEEMPHDVPGPAGPLILGGEGVAGAIDVAGSHAFQRCGGHDSVKESRRWGASREGAMYRLAFSISAKRSRLLSTLLAGALGVPPSAAIGWQVEIDGTASGLDKAVSVTVDGAGDVIAAGRIRNSSTVKDFAVIKFSGSSGAELWRQEIDGTVGTLDEAFWVTVDGVRDVIAAGQLDNSGSLVTSR